MAKLNKILSIFITIILLIFYHTSNFCYGFESEFSTIAKESAEQVKKTKIKTIAVVDFTNLNGGVTELGRFIAEELSVHLSKYSSDYSVVDRTHLVSVLKEHKLISTGLIDPNTARKLGKITGVEAILTGSIIPLEKEIRITVKILDTNTAKIIGATSGNITKTKAINDLIDSDIDNYLDKDSARNVDKILAERASGDFLFQLKELKRSAAKIYCKILITNKSEKEMSVHFEETSMYDQFGTKYIARKNQLMLGGKIMELSPKFVPNIPVLMEIFFNNISSDFQQASVVLAVWQNQRELRSREKINVSFTNIKLGE